MLSTSVDLQGVYVYFPAQRDDPLPLSRAKYIQNMRLSLSRASTVVKRRPGGSVSVSRPRGELALHQLHHRAVGQPAVEAMALEDAQLEIGHVQPAAMLGGTTELRLVGRARTPRRSGPPHGYGAGP